MRFIDANGTNLRTLTAAERQGLIDQAWERQRKAVLRSAQEANLDADATFQVLRDHDRERGLMETLCRDCLTQEGATEVIKVVCDDMEMLALNPLGELQKVALSLLNVDVDRLLEAASDHPFPVSLSAVHGIT